MTTDQILQKLTDFKREDKYDAFYKILPTVIDAPVDQKNIINDILDRCCLELIQIHKTGRKPTKPILRKIIIKYMDELTYAAVDTSNRDFGYELCWFLSEKINIKLKTNSEHKVWGFWKIAQEEVKTIQMKNTR